MRRLKSIVGGWPISGECKESDSLPKRLRSIGEHTLVVILTLFSIWLVGCVLTLLYPKKELKFFDWIPIRYLIDVADLIAMLKYLIGVVKDLWMVVKKFRR